MAAACLLITSNILAHDFEVDGIYYKILSTVDKTVEVTYKGNSYYSNEYTGNVVIPESVIYNEKNYSVTSIGDHAFYGCSGLTSVEIPNSVTSIGWYAFEYCPGLTSIVIPNSVTSIGRSAFHGCYGLTSIEIPNSVTSIGNRAFYNCSGLTSIVIGNSVTSIGQEAFYNCEGLESVTIPNSVTSISSYAFYGCSGLTGKLVIPNSVTSIGQQAFSGCSGLTSVVIGNSVTHIGMEAFRGCYGLKDVYISDIAVWCDIGFIDGSSNPLYYANNLYLNGELVTELVIPNSVTRIGERSFDGCTGLKSIEIPNSVTSIGEGAFYDCSGLTGELVIPNSVTSISRSAFSGCSGLTSVVIGNSVTSIEYNTFSGCSGLTSVVIGNSVTSIGNQAFLRCSGLTGELVIPNSVTSIGNDAFYGCSGLTSVVIGNSVTSIGEEAFRNCSGLTSIVIPNSVTSIGEYAFSGCSGLTSIVIPNSVTSIGENAFSNCSGLTSIEIPDGVTSIGNSAFDGTTWYKNQPDGVVYAGKFLYKYKGTMPGNTSIVIKEGTTVIVDNAFSGCSGLTSIEIPNSISSLGAGTFGYCTSLESIELPNSVTTIPQKLFYGCSELTNVKIGNSVNEIDNSAFNGCKKLLMIIPKSVKYIGRDAFSGCAQAKLVILHKIQSIEDTGIMPRSAHIYVPTETLKEHYAAYSDSVKYIFTEEVTPTATTLFLKITNNIPEIIESENIAIDNYDNVTDGLTLTGLEPDTEYTYYVTTEEAGRIEKQVSARTESLTFKTLKAKATSNTRAVICAEANIANEEAGTGFEWRRIDAPDLVPSEFAGCAVHEGVMEGALHNLRADTYYKYRPYYCSAAGNYYYGDWIGFGTADAYVYFTPTVHTYASAKRGVNSVCLNGYALAGSDDIREQGFEYWPVGTVQAAPSRNGDARNGASRVTASGQRMSIVIEDLEYGTVYACRAYVVTDSETFYGEEITFETSYPTGIADVYEKENEPSILVQGNTIVVSGHKPGDRVLVYTMHGAVIYNGTADEEITLENGMYIVNIGNTTKKVRIR